MALKPPVKLISLNERAERRYGKAFDAHPVLARTLKAIKWADDAPAASSAPIAAPPPLVPVVDPLDGLRREYMTASGSSPDKRWGESRLRNEIDRSRNRYYERRDMLPED